MGEHSLKVISLLEAVPELGNARGNDGLPDLEAPTISLSRGAWEPPLEEAGERFGYLIVTGMLLRRVRIESGTSVELLGDGDCLLPWREEPASFSAAEWEVVEHARLAVLDLRPGSQLSQWPAIAGLVTSRAIDRSRRLTLQAAIMSVVGIEDRLYAMLWALAERWGTMTPGGIALEIHVPQGVLGELVGARRPTVSLALGQLGERGLIEALGPGCWLLKGEPPAPAAEFDR